MIFALDNGMATVLAALITAVGIITVAYMNKVHKDNRADHAVVAQRLDSVHSDIKDVKKDMIDIKVDVGVLKGHQQSMQRHIDRIEETI